MRQMTPQKFDSFVRTSTTSMLALLLVGATVLLAFTGAPDDRLSGLQAVLVGWAGVIVGFYFGGHVAQNTAGLEEARQLAATSASEASAVRSESAATKSESLNPPAEQPRE
jgi:uncharacterized membrane protein YfcA